MFEFSAFLPPTNLGLPMHSPSALTEHVSLNFTRFFFARPCSSFMTYLELKPSAQELNAGRATSVKNSIFWEERGRMRHVKMNMEK